MSQVHPDNASLIRTAALAVLIGTSQQTVRDLTQRNILKQTGNSQGEYALIETVNAYTTHLRNMAAGRDQGDDYNHYKTQKMRADAAKATMQASTLSAELIPKSKIEKRWLSTARVMRAGVLAMTSRLTSRLNLSAEAAAIVKEEINDALSDLADKGLDQTEIDEFREGHCPSSGYLGKLLLRLSKSLAHLFSYIKRPDCGIASAVV